MSGEEAGAAVSRALLANLGPEAAADLAQAQVRVAWEEVVAESGQVEASEPILANELRLRGEALAWAVNRRMAGRPGATIELRGLAVSVARWD